MAVRFFGHFLIERGEIDEAQIRQGIEHIVVLSRTLAELALERGYMSPMDIDWVHREQSAADFRFGELAVQLGILTRTQLNELLADQNSREMRLGNALVELGHLQESRRKELLELFDQDQAPYTQEHRQLPEALRSVPLSALIPQLMPKLAMRSALLLIKLGAWTEWDGSGCFANRFSIPLRGEDEVDLGLASDEAFGVALASQTTGISPAALEPAQICEVLSEFLQDLAEQAKSTLGGQLLDLRIGTPTAGVLPRSGFALDFISVRGSGVLIIEAR